MVGFDDDDGSDDYRVFWEEEISLEIDFSLLENYKSLYHLSSCRITPEIVDWLSESARNFQELFITDIYNIYHEDLDLLNVLKFNSLSTLYVTDDDDDNPEFFHRSPGRRSETRETAIVAVIDRLSLRNDLSYLSKLSITFQFETQWVGSALHFFTLFYETDNS